MDLMIQLELAAFLVLSAILSMAIGMDRQANEQPAGLRTHMLVGIGSCLFTMLSIYAFPNTETGRVAAQVVSGIGFLGAGTILQRKGNIHHLTTAASIWATAAVGMAVGVGAWFLAIIATIIIWFVLSILRRFKERVYKTSNGNGGNGQKLALPSNGEEEAY